MRVLLLSGLTHGLLVALFAHYVAVARPLSDKGSGTIRSAVEQTARLDEEAPPPLPPPPERAVDCDPENVRDATPESEIVEPEPFEPTVDRRTDFTFSVPSRITGNLRRTRPTPRRSPAATPPPPPPPSLVVYRPPARPVGPTRGALAIAGNRPPVYPPRAESMGLTGLVLLTVRLDRDGRVVAVVVTRGSGHVILDREAVRAVKGWAFKPALNRGKPVPSEVEVPIRFTGS